MKQKLRDSIINESAFKSHPIHRMSFSLLMAIIAFFFIRHTQLNQLLRAMVEWDVFALSMLSTSWYVLFTRPQKTIRQLAIEEDGSIFYVFFIILVASFASMFTVLLLMMSNDKVGTPKEVYIPVVIVGIMSAWVMVHTTFTFHYARVYYSNDDEDNQKHAAGLCFPDEDCPDYVDFAYYAFVIGMTFQVSDVETRSRRFRRLTLAHSLLSFGLNTFVVALTINLIASLKG